jgi:hypothetical protein
MDGWDEELRTYLFSEGDVTGLEDASENGNTKESDSLGIGDLS